MLKKNISEVYLIRGKSEEFLNSGIAAIGLEEHTKGVSPDDIKKDTEVYISSHKPAKVITISDISGEFGKCEESNV